MSTVSSQLLVASSSLTEDIYRTVFKRGATERELVNVGRLAVLAVGAVAVIIASNPDSEVLGLVANAWAGFGAAFGPLIILALTWKRMTGAGAVAGLVVGDLLEHRSERDDSLICPDCAGVMETPASARAFFRWVRSFCCAVKTR